MGVYSSATTGITHRPPPPPVEHGWGGDGGNSEGRGVKRSAAFTGLFVLTASVSMVFIALIVAFLARRNMSDNWFSFAKPPILFVNTAILIASSVALDFSRRALKARRRDRFNFWWTTATILGLLFLGGQFVAWHDLRDAGVFVGTNPASAFFYILTVAHAFHLLGGLAALVYVDVQALRLRLGPAKRTAIDVSSIFWHFLDVVWVGLMVLFYVWG